MHLITGGSGFVGSHIAKQLVARGEAVRVLDIWRSDDLPDEVAFVQADILDINAVDRACQGVDYIHHNVALVPLTKAGKKYQAVNVGGTKIIVDMAKKHRVKMLCHMSSSAIFGAPDTMPIAPESPMGALEIYGQAKADADALVQSAIKDGLPACCIRPRTVIGEGRLGIFEILFDWIKDDANIFIIGKGNNLFQFVHVEDLANVSIESALQKKSGLYNVGTHEFATLREDLEYMIRAVGKKSKVIGLPVGVSKMALYTLDKLGLSPLSPWHYLTYHKAFYYDTKHIQDALNWTPKHSNRDMMVHAYAWFVDSFNKHAIKADASSHTKPVKQGVLKMLKYISRIF